MHVLDKIWISSSADGRCQSRISMTTSSLCCQTLSFELDIQIVLTWKLTCWLMRNIMACRKAKWKMNECYAGDLITFQNHNSLLIFCLVVHLSIPVYVTQGGLDLSYPVFTCICLVALQWICERVCEFERVCVMLVFAST